ncbi:hypothetical protein NPS01_10090 [Nocardioides psychrotolerans]|uniref:Mce-associated membrane protein n=1 Tax=Nocardioides psychrotolerans TaxID=1005945 RepID=A0A1I3FWV7_9ACTN|nr:hypothetical protein [Nocardioides psychrotolerans]GEP37346.1 hypothetical protein NPS01_10090 [Nocardioides psychrotolerans]SFI15562.1 Mce-associated membrane protein [Nocardioides psychrotolerans]
MSASGPGPRPPKRPRGARTPTSRPRKVAGRTSGPGDPLDEALAEAPASAPEPEVHHEHVEWPIEDEQERPPSRLTTGLLAGLVVLLAVVAAGEGFYLYGQDDPVVSSDRPIVTGKVAATSAVDTAARSAVDIVSSSFRTYDEQVDLAASKMTDSFAEEFRQTKDEIRDDFVAQKTEVTAEVAAQGVVQASPEQVVALVFLDQSTTKAGTDLNVAQYKILVTVVRTEGGWLVSQLETI